MCRIVRNNVLVYILAAAMFMSNIIPAYAGNERGADSVRVMPMGEFIEKAVENDTIFEAILIDELTLRYRKDLNLPAKDLILEIKSQYEFFLDYDKSDPAATISLSKLFPYTGTDISAQYSTMPSASSDKNSSDFTLFISQPIASNAFGKATLLQDRIIGTEIDVIRHQIIEAYEDYMATVITAYYNWYLAYENLKIGESSYEQNSRLLENVKNRRSSSIALPIDVNKVNIQILAKKEDLIKLQEKYENILNFIKQIIRYKGNETIVPADPLTHDNRDIVFEDEYGKFIQTSRTYQVLNLLEEKSSLEVKKDADDLLPSTNLLLGYEVEGEDMGIKNPDSLLFAGVSLKWPFPSQKERAEYEVSKIEDRKTRLSNKNKYVQLHTDLKGLFIQIEREKKLISIAEEKIKLAESILKDETKNYSYGKVSLNDFIDAVNRVDENKFNKILRSVELKILMTEWLRMTDQLVSKKDIKKIPE